MNPQQPSNVDRDRATPPNPSDAVIRRPMRVVPRTDQDRQVYSTAGLKGGKLAAGAADLRMGEPELEIQRKGLSRSAFFIIAAKDAAGVQTPIFDAGPESAVALFTSREDAQRYMHAAGWDKDYETRDIGPAALADWLRGAK